VVAVAAAAPGTPPRGGAEGGGAAAFQEPAATSPKGRLRRSLATTAARRRSSLGTVVEPPRRSSLAAAVRSRQSYPHRDFHNPEAETCWLSCLFQCIFHSTVFHRAFEAHLTAERHQVTEAEPILEALQLTWADYKASTKQQQQYVEPTAEELQVHAEACGGAGDGGRSLVAPEELASAFGEGYGDMSEALAMMQEELSQSQAVAARGLAEALVMLPLTVCEGALPSPKEAWTLVEEWQAASRAFLAVDLSLAEPSAEEGRRLAQLWVPQVALGLEAAAAVAAGGDGGGSGAQADLGPRHVLVALVCYMWSCQHYVAFCRRQRDTSRCIFFNDLPTLTAGAPRELNWSDVPEFCSRYHLTPRLVFYEDPQQCPTSG